MIDMTPVRIDTKAPTRKAMAVGRPFVLAKNIMRKKMAVRSRHGAY